MHSTEHIVFYRNLSAEQGEALQQMLATDPVAARQFHVWHTAREAIARELAGGLVDREIFCLFVLFDGGRGELLSASERKRLEAASPVIRGALQRHGGLASVAQDVHADATAFEVLWNDWFEKGADHILTLNGRSNRQDRPANRRRSSANQWLVRTGMGAAVAVFVVLLLILGRREVASVTISTSEGEVRLVELGDGSAVRMLGDSRLTYVRPEDASALDRRVDFEGNAFFDIASADRGFVIRTPNARAVVLGTSFGIRADAEETEIVLAEGRLALASRGASEHGVVLSPGQMSRVGAAQGPTSPENVRVHARLAWTGLFVFRAAPLQEILTELGRFYLVDVSADEALLAEEVTGRFDQTQDLREILDVVAAAVGARVQPTGTGGYRLATA